MTRDVLRRHTLRICVLVLAVVAITTVMAQFARVAWLGELAVNFRMQYLLVAVVVACAAACIRHRRLALLAMFVVAPNAWFVVPRALPMLVPESEASAIEARVSLISLNLHYRNSRHEQVREYLRSRNPDLLVLSELTPEWRSELRQFMAGYPYWMSLDRTNPWGLGVFSRFPLRDASATNLGASGSVNVVATVVLPSGDLDLVAVHLQSPGTPRRAALRNQQLANLATLLQEKNHGNGPRRLLVGDLNVTPYSPRLSDLLTSTGMQLSRPAGAWLGTWPTWMPPLRVAIDHCISDPAVTVSHVERGPWVGSDHFPLEITLH
jgi:endonuclease/exonuclease/phosphatase (EEP) superfamily protein YafD